MQQMNAQAANFVRKTARARLLLWRIINQYGKKTVPSA